MQLQCWDTCPTCGLSFACLISALVKISFWCCKPVCLLTRTNIVPVSEALCILLLAGSYAFNTFLGQAVQYLNLCKLFE